MKYGCHNYIFTDKWSDDRVEILEQAAKLGLSCFEIAVGDDTDFDIGITKGEAEANGLELIISPGGVWPAEMDLSSDDPEERERALSWHKRWCDFGEDLGAAAYTGALFGHPGTVKKRRPPRDEYSRTAEGLHKLAEHAQGCDIKIALEPMSHFRTHMVNNCRQLMELISMADHENLYALFDTYHMITEERDMGNAIRGIGDRLWGVHACGNDRGVPGGDLVPWESVFNALKDISFDGYMLMETYNSSIGDFPYEHMMFHNVCPDGEQFVKDGLAFLKSKSGD